MQDVPTPQTVVADDKKRITWMNSHNQALGGVPLQLVQTATGLVATLNYLEGMRSSLWRFGVTHLPWESHSMTNKNVDPSSGATSLDRSLIENACAHVAELQETFKAYIALEHLISPEYEDEEESFVQASRAQLGALLHVMNAEIFRRVEVLREMTARLQAGYLLPPSM